MEQYIDINFNKDFAHSSSLLLEIDTQQFSFLIYDKQNGKIHALKRMSFNNQLKGTAFTEQLKSIINKEDLLHLLFKETKISLTFQAFTLVPKTIFDEVYKEKYLNHSAHVSMNENIDVNSIHAFFLKNIFSCNSGLKAYLQHAFPGAKFFHLTSSLLEYTAQNNEDFANSQLIIDVHQDVIHLLYMQEKKLLYLNQFQYKNKEDFLYYVLLVCDQLDVDRTLCELKLSGFITIESELYTELYKFFSGISFVPALEHFTVPEELQSLPVHYYTTLMSLHLCA